jgi:hypothetical protein
MRVSLAAISTDRVSSSAILLAGLSCGALVFFVGLPLARSSPFPAATEGGWSVHRESYRLASLMPVPPLTVAWTKPRRPVEWEAMMPPSGILDLPVVKASLAPESTKAAASESDASVETAHTGSIMKTVVPARRPAGTMDEVDAYLWEVYQRQPVKRDATGDFSWKDPKAAKRFGISMPAYVIGGMDRDFREQIYSAGKAMDAAGIRWSILSAFRDDYRQQLASGLKARPGYSLHGGSRRTGGYGHGRAVDVMSADGNHAEVWRWIDRHGAKYGLYRPLPGADPVHVQPRNNWHQIGVALRAIRLKNAALANRQGADNTKVANAAR